MGSTGAGKGAGAGAGRASNLRPMTAKERAQFKAKTGRSLRAGAMTTDRAAASLGTPNRRVRRTNATPMGGRPASQVRSGAVSREEFERATGVNPRTGRRTRRR